jgi:hypothetical protein
MNLETIVKPTGPIDKGSVVNRARELNNRLPRVSPKCEAIAVVPVFREFEGGRIMNLLEELQAQYVGSRRFETILVVNNPPSSDISGLKGLVDNLKFLAHINEQKQAGNFPDVKVLDCSRGEVPKRHMGLVRGLGQLVAEERLDQTETGDKGIIVQLDADVSVDPNFVAKLLKAYQDPLVHAAMIGRIPLPMDFLSDDYYITYANRFAEAVESHLTGHVVYSSDGPTLSLRAFRHKDAGVRRYMDKQVNEDFELGDALSENGRFYLLAEPRVYKGDRIRPDGFDSISREAWVKMGLLWNTAEVLLNYAFINLPVTEGEFKFIPQSEFWQKVKTKLVAENPEGAARLQAYLDHEEVLGRRALDWDNLDPQLRDQALHLYAFSRLAMGDRQMLSLPHATRKADSYTSLIYNPLENHSLSKIYQPLKEQPFPTLGATSLSSESLASSTWGPGLFNSKSLELKEKEQFLSGYTLGSIRLNSYSKLKNPFLKKSLE